MASLAGFFKLLKVFWNNADALVSLLEKLPPALNAAGEEAIQVSYDIKGGGGVAVNARDTVNLAATAVGNTYAPFIDGATIMRHAGGAIADLKVPTVTIHTGSVAGVHVVTGIDLGEVAMFADVGHYLKSEADKLQAVGNELKGAADHLHGFGDSLDHTGNSLRNLGQDLKQATGG
jgi:hypothetical protein